MWFEPATPRGDIVSAYLSSLEDTKLERHLGGLLKFVHKKLQNPLEGALMKTAV